MAKLKDTPNDEVKTQIIEKEVIKEVIIEKSIKSSETTLDIFNELSKQYNLSLYVNDFFKHYFNLGFKELNTILSTNNCIELLSSDLTDLLKVYLLAFKEIAKTFTKHNQPDKTRLLTNNLRQLYPFKEFVQQNYTMVFETQDKKYFLGAAYKLYSIQKENK
jgi:deoxyribodipyrimidine photolyase-like uncharacterized protein